MDYTQVRTIFTDIEKELEYARGKWGTAFDNRNTLNDWVTYTAMYATEAARMDTPPTRVRPLLIKAAGLLISAIERLDVNGRFAPRHYDKLAESGTLNQTGYRKAVGE